MDVGGGGVGDGAPCDGLEFLDASTGAAQRVCLFGLRTRNSCPNYAPVCLVPTYDSGQSRPRLFKECVIAH